MSLSSYSSTFFLRISLSSLGISSLYKKYVDICQEVHSISIVGIYVVFRLDQAMMVFVSLGSFAYLLLFYNNYFQRIYFGLFNFLIILFFINCFIGPFNLIRYDFFWTKITIKSCSCSCARTTRYLDAADDESYEKQSQNDVTAKLMWSPELLNDSLEFFVGFRKIITQTIHTGRDFLNFSINFTHQITSLCDISFQCVDLIINHINILVNCLLSLLPLLHLFHLDFTCLLVQVFYFGVCWKYCIIWIVW